MAMMVEIFAGNFSQLIEANTNTTFCDFGLDGSMDLPFADILNQIYI